jgi:hypothetical protein
VLEPGQVEELKQLMALLPQLVLKYQFVEEEKKKRIAVMEARAAAELTSKNDGGSISKPKVDRLRRLQ